MESPRSKSDPQVQSAKKTYRSPSLIDYGTVAQVTQAGAPPDAPLPDGLTLSS